MQSGIYYSRVLTIAILALGVRQAFCLQPAAGLVIDWQAADLAATNRHFSVAVAGRTGRITLRDSHKRIVIEGVSAFTLASGRRCLPGDYPEHRWIERRGSTSLGRRAEFVLTHSGNAELPDFIQEITVDEDGRALFLRSQLSASAHPRSRQWTIGTFEVFSADLNDQSGHWLAPATRDEVTMLRQGTRMPSDRRLPVTLAHAAFPPNYDFPYYNRWLRKETPAELTYISESLATFIHRTTQNRIFFGFVTQWDQATQIWAARKKSEPQYLGIRSISDREDTPLHGTQSVASEVLMIDPVSEPADAASAYVQQLILRHGQPSKKELGSIWNTWHHYRKRISEAEVLKNVEAIAQMRLPIEYIAIDDGFYDVEDEWLGTNERFPHGMRWLSEQIRSRGYKASIWINPFLTLVGSRLSREHPDFLLKDKKGGLVRTYEHNVCPFEPPPGKKPPAYVIDFTVPSAREWLRRLTRTLVHEWGYTRIKLDGPARHYYDGHGLFSDPSVTTIGNIRIAYQIMREEMGDQAYLSGEGYFGPSYGYADGHNFRQDWEAGWSGGVSYEGGDPSKWRLSGELANVVSRQAVIYPWPAWDPSYEWFRFSYKRSPLWEEWVHTDSVPEGLARIGWTREALGQRKDMSLNEKLYDLNFEESKRLHQFFPIYVSDAKRLDGLPDYAPPLAKEKAVSSPWERWSLVGLWNYSSSDRKIEVSIPKTSVPRDAARYHVFAFWNEQYLGNFADQFEVTVPAQDAALLAVRPVRDHPHLISTNMHYTQGAVELSGVGWNYRTRTLHLASAFGYQAGTKLFVFVPTGYVLSGVQSRGARNVRSEMSKELLTIAYDSEGETEFDIVFR